MKYKLSRENSFKRSYKKLKLSDKEEQSYIDIIYKLLNDEILEDKYKNHQLKSSLEVFRECHIKPDLLLIYRIKNNTLELVEIGSHSELFR